MVWSQLETKTACIWRTAGPSTRTWVSRQTFSESASPSQRSSMHMPPVKPTLPSTTRILRWVRWLMLGLRFHQFSRA